MAQTDAGLTTTGQRSLLRRLLGSRWALYFVGLEVFLAAIVFLALQFMSTTPFQGIVVGMAISIGVLVAVVGTIVLLVVTLRDTFESVLGNSYRHATARSGLLYVAGFALVGVATRSVASATVPGALGDNPLLPTPTGLTLPVSPAVAAPLLLGVVLVAATLALGAFRTFASDTHDRLPTATVTANLVPATAWLILGAVAYIVLTTVGLALLVVPGVFVAVSLFFWPLPVAIEDRSTINAFYDSWELTRSHRLPIFALVVAVVLVNAIVALLAAVPALLLPPTAGYLVGQLGIAFGTVYGLAATAKGYTQLTQRTAE